MFLDFANFYKQFIKSFSRIAALLTLILKTMAPSVSARPTCIKTNKRELGIDSGDSISDGRINNIIVNLSNSTKKISYRAGFLTSKASLAFT